MSVLKEIKPIKKIGIKNTRNINVLNNHFINIKADNELLYIYNDIENRKMTPDIIVFNEKMAKYINELNKEWIDFLVHK